MKEYLKPKMPAEQEIESEAKKPFNHEQHMEKVARTALKIIELAQGLMKEEETEEEASDEGTLYDKVMKKV